ncbi:hypothetical protein ES703_06211 [subsurface metagenome]
MKDKPVNQKGITLVELVIAIGISSFVIVGAAVAIFQLITVSDRNSNYMTAYTEVQNAGFSVSRDATQAQAVDDTSGFVTLDWVDWEGDAHKVVYTLEDASDGLKELWRTYSINDVPQETMRVARYIDPVTNLAWNASENVLTLVITAQVGDQTATRTYNVKPRPLS